MFGWFREASTFRFALKTREPIDLGRERRWQDLDRDLALESRVGRPIHVPHLAFPDRRGYVVDADARARSRGQMCVGIEAEPVRARSLLAHGALLTSSTRHARERRLGPVATDASSPNTHLLVSDPQVLRCRRQRRIRRPQSQATDERRR